MKNVYLKEYDLKEYDIYPNEAQNSDLIDIHNSVGALPGTKQMNRMKE